MEEVHVFASPSTGPLQTLGVNEVTREKRKIEEKNRSARTL